MKKQIEVFSTGGGIVLAESKINEKQYAVISSEAPEFLTIYNVTNGEEAYLPEDMVTSLSEAEMSAEIKDLYTEMLEKLKKA